MNTIINNYLKTFITQIGLHKANKCNYIKNGFGISNSVDADAGTGFHWMYPVDDTCIITHFNLCYYNDMNYCYNSNPKLVISRCTQAVAKPVLTQQIKSKTVLLGYEIKNETQKYVIPKNTPIQNVSIIFSPEYFKTYKEIYGDVDFSSMPEIFSLINGSVKLPQVEAILNQIAAYVPRSIMAKAYYKAKIIELTSLIFEWGKYKQYIPSTKFITDTDREYLDRMIHNIQSNLNKKIDVSTLAKNCCMSKAKLTYLFRQIYDMSIMDYVQELRIERTKELLIDSDLSIAEIANMVGYNCSSSLSEMFRKKTGQTPKQYRKQSRS